MRVRVTHFTHSQIMRRPRMRPLIRVVNYHIRSLCVSCRSLGCNSNTQRSTFSHRSMTTTNKPKVFVTRKVPEEGIKLLRENCIVTQWDSEDTIPRDKLLEGVKNVDGLFCLLTDKINAEVLDAAGPSLRAISTMSVGYDHVDIKECSGRNIPVGYTPDVLTNATAELTVALLLSTSRRLKEGIRAVADGSWGTWNPLWLCGHGLDGSTVGIIGFGRIGLTIAKCLKPFGVKRIVYSDMFEMDTAKEVSAEFVSIDTLLEQSDFVLGCCALTKENTGMMNASAFKKMKRNAVFVNTSRGGLVNQDDLYNALVKGEIAAAGLDVTVPEPLPTNHPLLTLDNCVILPHIGSATTKSRNAMSFLCAKNIVESLSGRDMPARVK